MGIALKFVYVEKVFNLTRNFLVQHSNIPLNFDIMVYDHVYLWEDPFKSGFIFTSVLVVLISICYYSFVSVVAYTALFMLGISIAIKICICFTTQVLKKEVSNPLQYYMAFDPKCLEEGMDHFSLRFLKYGNMFIVELRDIFLIEEFIASIKFGISLWLLTYVGSIFNAITIVIIAWTGLFTIPKVYLNNKSAIDPPFQKMMYHLTDVSKKLNFSTVHQFPPPKECIKDE